MWNASVPSYLASRTFLVVHSFTCILVSGCLIPLASTILNVSPRQDIFHEEPPAQSCGPLPGVALGCMDVLAHNTGGRALLSQPHSRGNPQCWLCLIGEGLLASVPSAHPYVLLGYFLGLGEAWGLPSCRPFLCS